MNRHRRLLALFFAIWLVLPTGAAAQQSLRAAAIVNDEVISILDLEMRVRLAMLAVGAKNDSNARRRIAPQVLRTLIDERLQLQEAKRLGIEVPQRDIDAAIDRLAKQNNRSRTEFLGVLQQRGILLDSLEEQLRATIAWQGVIARSLRPQVTISEEEVQSAIVREQSSQGQLERLVAEIFLSVDSPDQDEEIRRSAQRLVEQLTSGARFQDLARQFSQSATAPVGGDLGWVRDTQLPAEISSALQDMSPGQIGGPVRSLSGYHIVFFRQQRTIKAGEQWLSLKQVFLPVAEAQDAAAVDKVRAEAADLSGTLNGCESMEAAATRFGDESGDLGEVKVGDLPAELRNAVVALDIGTASAPIQRTDGFVVLMVCDRRGQGVNRRRIESRLERERIDMLSRRHLRDLRRSANVEMRI